MANNEWLLAAGAAGIAFGVAGCATPAAIRALRGAGVVDVPNARSSHARPVPRGGGAAIALGFYAALAAAWAMGGVSFSPALLAGALLIAAAGAADDALGGIGVAARLGLQTGAAALAAIPAGGFATLPLPAPLDAPLGPLAIPAAMLWIVGTVNIVNFLDGVDGFAAVQSVVAGLALAAGGFGPATTITGIALAAASAGFLPYNWTPARVFLGDVGSTFIGFVLAAAPFQAAAQERAPIAFVAAMSLWFFLADGAFTLARRLYRRERIWEAHRSHVYQRWTGAGAKHSSFVMRIAPAMLAFSAAGVVSVRLANRPVSWAALALAGVAFTVYAKLAPKEQRRMTGRAAGA